MKIPAPSGRTAVMALILLLSTSALMVHAAPASNMALDREPTAVTHRLPADGGKAVSRRLAVAHDPVTIKGATAGRPTAVTPLPARSLAMHYDSSSPEQAAKDSTLIFAGAAKAATVAVNADAAQATSSDAFAAIASSATAAQAFTIPWSRFRAVTVVHEPCSTLSFTLTNFAGNLGPEWPILLIYTPRAEDAVLNNKAVRYLARYGGLHTLPLSALAIPGLDELTNVSMYSRLLARPEFWEAMHADKVLVFQVDSVLCSASPWTIDDFLAYDYIGAPWVHAEHIVGNGGLSLRSVDKMLYITRHFSRNPHPEDVYFVEGLASMARNDVNSVIRAPKAVAQKFAFEMDVHPDVVPFGVHRSVIVPVNTKASVINGCPEAAIGVWTSCGRRE